jgi:hypothetical protein
MNTTQRPQTMVLFVVSIMFDGDNLPALFELRAAGWTVEIEHSEAIPDWDRCGTGEPQVYFNIRKLLPDNSPGNRADEKLMRDVADDLRAYEKKWGAFFDELNAFKNPKPMAWRFNQWRDWHDEWRKRYERS